VEGAPWQLDVIAECGTCHAESLRTYRDTFHGKATTLGFARVAKCADCHGSHEIQPTGDPRSRVSAANVMSAGSATRAQLALHAVQPPPTTGTGGTPALLLVPVVTSLLVGTFAFFGLHTALWHRALRRAQLRHRREHRRARSMSHSAAFAAYNRILHGMVITSFLGLA
jgi:hypothetical protein